MNFLVYTVPYEPTQGEKPMTTEQNKSPPKAHEVTPDMLIEMGRANSIESANRLQEISRLEETNAELLEALENLLQKVNAVHPQGRAYNEFNLVYHAGKAAIAKARGQQ
jgi:hypothetical protein